MPRRPRLDAPGSFHHVWMRGVDRRDIFLDARDREVFVARLALVLPDEGAACFAWALLSNHVHLVLRSGERPIGRAIHRIGTAYAGHFNVRHGHEGHVFQGRFGSRLVASDSDLANLIRYVHRNPIAAGLVGSVDALARFRWSGYAGLLDPSAAEAFHSIADTLAWFGPTVREARAEICRQMREPDPIEADESAEGLRERRLAALVGEICFEFGVPEWELRQGGRSRGASAARAAIARIARRELGVPDAVIADALGVSRQALWRRLGARDESHQSRKFTPGV